MEREYIGVPEAGRLCLVDDATVRRWLREGRIAGTKIGQAWLIDRVRLESQLARAEDDER